MIDAGSIMSYLDIDGNPFRREISSAISQLHTFGDKSKDIDTRINALSNSMTTMGLSLTKHVTTPLVGLGAAAVKFFGDFEEGINKISTLDTDNILDIPQLKKDILSLSSDIGVSTNELNEATYQMGSAMGEAVEVLIMVVGIREVYEV